MRGVSSHGFMLEHIEPKGDPVFEENDRARRAYWNHIGQEGLRIYRRRILRGRDVLGAPVAPLGRSTIEHRRQNKNWRTGKGPYSPMGRADPKAPPLAPNREKSRIIALMRYDLKADHRGVWFYWLRDPHTGKDWGEILAHHARGYVAQTYRGQIPVPARDQLGFQLREINLLRKLGDRWWQANRHRWETQETREEAVRVAITPPTGVHRRHFPPPEPHIAASGRRGLFGRLGRAVTGTLDRAVDKLLERTFGRFTGRGG